MVLKLIGTHLREIFTWKKIIQLYLLVLVVLLLQLYRYHREQLLFDQSGNLIQWVQYSVGGPIGWLWLIQGGFFLTMLAILIYFSRPLYEKNNFLYYILLSKAKTKQQWLLTLIGSQLISSVFSILVVVQLTLIVGVAYWNFTVFESIITIQNSLKLFTITMSIWMINTVITLLGQINYQKRLSGIVIAALLMLLMVTSVYIPQLNPYNPLALTMLNNYSQTHEYQSFIISWSILVGIVVVFYEIVRRYNE